MRKHPKQVAELVRWLDEHIDVSLVVQGHTDAVGSPGYNVALSHQRAKSVARIIRKAGAARRRLTVRAFGFYQPVLGAAENAGVNRRVTLTLVGDSVCGLPAGGIR